MPMRAARSATVAWSNSMPGILAVTDWLSLAMIADWAGHAGCLREYSEYLSTLAGHNSRRTSSRAANCASLSTISIPTQPRSVASAKARCRMRRSTQAQSGTARPDPRFGRHHRAAARDRTSRARTRQRPGQQLPAAAAARDRSGSLGRHHRRARGLRPAPFRPRCFFSWQPTGGGTLEDEIRSSHPSGLHRVRDLLVQTRALLDRKTRSART